MPTRSTHIAAALILALVGCTKTVALDVPLRYAMPAPAGRLSLPCLFALDPELDAAVLVNYPVRVPLGPAVAAQVESVLMQLCGSARRVTDPAEFLELAGQRAALLFSIRLSAELSASVLNSSTSTGFASGDARVTGPNGAEGVRYLLEGRGSFQNDAYKAVDGAEGLREALRRAFQSLLDQAVRDRRQLLDVAQPLASPTP